MKYCVIIIPLKIETLSLKERTVLDSCRWNISAVGRESIATLDMFTNSVLVIPLGECAFLVTWGRWNPSVLVSEMGKA